MTARVLAWSPAAPDMPPRPEVPWDWTLLADCQYTDPEAFFPEKGGSTREVRRICRGCPVRAECLQYALGNDEGHGIWAGLSVPELRRERQQDPVRPAAEILADADARYDRRRDLAGIKNARRLAAERRRSEEAAAPVKGLAA